MNDGALRPYEQSLRASGQLVMVDGEGRQVTLNVARWLAPADPSDDTVLERCAGPVLDIGCGPGRLVRALSERGVACLGVDIAETAVQLTQGLGVPALLRNVFGQVPGEGRWPTVLLMDGNVGIGGDPRRLLARAARLLAADGRLIVETEPDPAVERVSTVRFLVEGRPVGPSFGWAEIGLEALRRHAERAGLYPADVWSAGGRTFTTLASRLTLTR
ncbi:MAG: class I SAM-dependent methyltransferase [Jatrophihabitantaceae bacterium]